MGDAILQLVLYFGRLLLLTLGTVLVCGLAVRACANAFSRLLGGGADRVFDVTAIIGTPIHELGHALMCPLFCHKIRKMRLWSPTAQGGVYGFVEHSYSKKNAWARLGNLFIGIGPIFSGLGIVVLTLWLCFPDAWADYLITTRGFAVTGGDVQDLLGGMVQLLCAVLGSASNVLWRTLLGIVIILSVALHISLSWADIKGSLNALPLYLLLVAAFAVVSTALGVDARILTSLRLFHLRLLSLFCVDIAFAAVWVGIALLYRMCRIAKSWF